MSHYGDEIAAKRRVVKGSPGGPYSLTSLGVFRQVIGVNSQLKPVGTYGITQAPNIHWRAKSTARPGGDSRAGLPVGAARIRTDAPMRNSHTVGWTAPNHVAV